MTRTETVLEKLTNVSDEEWKVAMARCKMLINHRTAGKAVYGAHSEAKLGMTPFEYYFQEAVTKLYDGSWDWKFEKFTLSEQLCRIIGSLISEAVRKFKIEKEKSNTGKGISDVFVSLDEKIDFLVNVASDDEINSEEAGKIFEEQLNKIMEVIDGDQEMEGLFFNLLDGKSYEEICREQDWKKEKLYKVVERLRAKFKKANS